MSVKETKDYVFALRLKRSDLEALEKIASLNHLKPTEMARRALEMLIQAYEGQLNQSEDEKKTK